MSFAPFADALRALSGACRDANADWYLFGAQAALFYGAARLTADIDVTVRMIPEAPERLAMHLSRHGIGLRVHDTDFVRQTRVLPAVHHASTINIDIVLAGPGLEELFLSRATTVEIEGVRMPIACPEDLIAMKILAGRPKDLQDVEAIVAAQSNLDLAMVSETLSVLEEALAQSDLLPAFDAIVRRATGA